jgi:membrane fusion protein, copper/silver efflux system
MNEIDRSLPAGGPAGPSAVGPGDTTPAPPVHAPPPRGAGFMNAFRWGLFAGLLGLAAVSIGSYVMSKQPKTVAKQAAKKVIYQCPMHPSYTSDKPGECPICGMTLEPVESSGPDGGSVAASGPRRILFYRNPMNPSVTSPVPMKDEMGMDYVPVYSDQGQAATDRHGDVPGLTSVTITPERVQLIGVRTARVEKRALGGRLDLVGFVAPDETQLRRVQLRVAGWVQELYLNRTGERVAAGQPLLAIYSPELYQSEQEFLIELSARDSMSAMAHEAGAAGASRERLRLLGVPEGEIDRLERERSAATRLVLTAPFAGTVLERGVVEGQYVGADTPLFSLADLSRVWVLADLYEMDFGRVHAGDRARFTADALPGRAFEGRVDFVYPTVSSETRTVKLRIALENPAGELRPGMYGRVLVTAAGASTLVIPGEAVVNTGESDYVFLARAGGHFEPRMVSVGVQDGDQVQILKGLAEGDTVVASASFLIDSESRLKAAIAGMGKQPETGHPH